MRVTLHEVSKGRGGQSLPTTSLEFHSGAVRFALAETEQRPTVLGLIASGRMRPDTGRVTIDGDSDNKALRRTIALVDAPTSATCIPTSPSPAWWVKSSCSPGSARPRCTLVGG